MLSNRYVDWFEQKAKNRFGRRYLPHEILQQHLQLLPQSISQHLLGHSEEGRRIHKLSWGNGGKKILVWSQMHGNEPTGTMALIDFFHFLHDHAEEGLTEKLWRKLQVIAVPMLNPDGAERFKRRNALGIDLNRDALKKEAKETRLLFDLLTKESPDMAFNLHDQRSLFSAGNSAHPATISFLVPSFNESRTVDKVREAGMGLVASLFQSVPKPLQANVGRYSDEFYPTATGDVIQKSGINCILIESGTFPNDPLRNTARKLNGLVLIKTLELLIGDEEALSQQEYLKIPENGKLMKDLVLRNATVKTDARSIEADVAFKMVETLHDGDLEITWELEDIGDLRFYTGYTEQEWEGRALNLSDPIAQLEQRFTDEQMRSLGIDLPAR